MHVTTIHEKKDHEFEREQGRRLARGDKREGRNGSTINSIFKNKMQWHK